MRIENNKREETINKREEKEIKERERYIEERDAPTMAIHSDTS